jgi:hypothetical protein
MHRGTDHSGSTPAALACNHQDRTPAPGLCAKEEGSQLILGLEPAKAMEVQPTLNGVPLA